MRFEVLGGHFAHHSWPTQWPSWQLVRPPRATRAACDATLAAHRGYTSPEPRSRPRRDALAAEAAHRRGSCLMPCCPCPRMRIRGRADAWLRSKRLTCTVPRRPCRGTDEPLPRACRGARSALDHDLVDPTSPLLTATPSTGHDHVTRRPRSALTWSRTARPASRREISERSRLGRSDVALGHRDAEYGSRSHNTPTSKRLDLEKDGAARVEVRDQH